ncbi:hypothetical protein SAMN05660909_00421 [Chitinophaga terrae (ex Kim and Jung 2007)]|uniref:Uncharacterized protein n=1 Tax=Chitinophaga terrae (ex Kim and Jung 2007) TaxID=408074 RepID=A0A1H3XQ90_9BACT|nr:hypothetical protein [Chitinophaga terrae (ex Kim and Jung 2007)]GEP89319.1 hypothetical protein CTE07_09640 [Chitinophaga terrae (ex Kim and Jung 2007)]SEA01503.1 hypothetical protein SAMN05660909_00421 [Chitinophaga terrae (ex Kim and Jung 2007)]
MPAGSFIDSGNNSPFAIHGTVTTTDEKQTTLIMKLIETPIAMNKKIVAQLEKKSCGITALGAFFTVY